MQMTFKVGQYRVEAEFEIKEDYDEIDQTLEKVINDLHYGIYLGTKLCESVPKADKLVIEEFLEEKLEEVLDVSIEND